MHLPMSLSTFLKLAKAARGIPSMEALGDLTKLTPYERALLLISLHEARRAGKHFDIRFGTPETNLFSWVSRKELPQKPGESIAVFQQPVHRYSYKNFSGEIPFGYGAGYVHPAEEHLAGIRYVDPNTLEFVIHGANGVQRYKLIRKARGGDVEDRKLWYLVNITPNPELPPKLNYKLIGDDEARQLLSQVGKHIASMQPKVDGALAIMIIKNGNLEIFSPRTSVRTNLPIPYTERVFGIKPVKVTPPELEGSVLLGELYAVQTDPKTGEERILPPNELSAILNSKLFKSIDQAKRQNINFKIFLFDVVRMGKNDDTPLDKWYERDYNTRREFMKKIIKYLPQSFHLPIETTDAQSASQLFDTIRKGDYFLTSEGVIFHPSTGIPIKHKFLKEINAYFKGIQPGEGKYKSVGAGGILFSLEPEGEPVGVVGTGLTDRLRKLLFEEPEKFLGRKMRIRYHEQFPSGKLRTPSFLGFAD